MNMITPNTSQKSFYGKAKVIETSEGEYNYVTDYYSRMDEEKKKPCAYSQMHIIKVAW